MITVLYDGSEKTKLPTNINIRQLGLLVNPQANSNYPAIANSETYSFTTDIVVSNGFGYFKDGELVYQTPNNANVANATFSATCVDYEPSPNKLRLTNTNGNFVIGNPIYGYSSGTVRTLLQTIYPDIVRYSGNIIYVENREPIARAEGAMELFRIVLRF